MTLPRHQADSLTVHGDDAVFQIRDGVLVIAPRNGQVHTLIPGDVARLRDLLNAATQHHKGGATDNPDHPNDRRGRFTCPSCYPSRTTFTHDNIGRLVAHCHTCDTHWAAA